MSFVISPLVIFSSSRTVLSNVSHLITMITLIGGEIFSLSLTLMMFLEFLWREILYESGSPFENETSSFYP
jgi:hypothetical protein